MGTKNNPGKFDCYANAADDEEMFILLARDRHYATLVRIWTLLREADVKAGLKGTSDLVQIAEAKQSAYAGERWRARQIAIITNEQYNLSLVPNARDVAPQDV